MSDNVHYDKRAIELLKQQMHMSDDTWRKVIAADPLGWSAMLGQDSAPSPTEQSPGTNCTHNYMIVGRCPEPLCNGEHDKPSLIRISPLSPLRPCRHPFHSNPSPTSAPQASHTPANSTTEHDDT